MFKKKIFILCPKCRSKLNPAKSFKAVSICEHCTWAGSYQSESHTTWIEYKVSAILLVAGLFLFASVAMYANKAGYHINPKVSQIFIK